MSTIAELARAIAPLSITAMIPARDPNARTFHAQLRDALLANPDRFAQLGEAMQAMAQRMYPSMPDQVAFDGAMAHIRLALTRRDLPPLPVAVTARARAQAQALVPVRPMSRRARKAEMIAAVRPVINQAQAERAQRYGSFARRRLGIPDTKPKVTVR